CIDGADTTLMSEAQRTALRGRTIGFVFQYHHLLPAFTALENVLLPVLAARGSVEAADEARARALLQRVGLGAAMGKRPGELSGGMQQRVAIARALVLQPRLPDRHADPRLAARCDRIVELVDGHIVADRRTAAPAVF
ncbi:MAG: ATP-binding cassette domain-containing protein, partial [Burkholderiaceae bacterium]|nr:ATP-binding cassette domain-containing protein [Burkholderiaceae bacterium]